MCEIAGIGPVPVEVVRQLLSDAVLKLVLTTGSEVRNVTSLGRGPNAAMKVALLWEQPTCSVERCGRRARLEADHTTGAEYVKTRHTRLDELDRLCDQHHDKKTYDGWGLVPGTGVDRWCRPMTHGIPRVPGALSACLRTSPCTPQTPRGSSMPTYDLLYDLARLPRGRTTGHPGLPVHSTIRGDRNGLAETGGQRASASPTSSTSTSTAGFAAVPVAARARASPTGQVIPPTF